MNDESATTRCARWGLSATLIVGLLTSTGVGLAHADAGELDLSFLPPALPTTGFSREVNSATPVGDGKFLIGGFFESTGGDPPSRTWRGSTVTDHAT